jgi:hypothetical protein
MESDPRLGLSSASSFGIDALCPGRQALLQTLPDLPEPPDEDRERGLRLHSAWEREDPSGLDSEDAELYLRGLHLVEEVKSPWLIWLQDSGPGFKEGKREERFWLHDEKGNLATSGQADRHYVCDAFGLVIDYKSLWCRSLTPAELNWQLLLLAVLIANEYSLNHVRCAFVKPMFNRLDIVDYNANDLKRAENAVQQVLWNQKHIDQRRPGPHCRHCKAVTACSEAKAWTLLPSVQTNAVGRITPTMAADLVESLNLQDCVRIWETQTSRRNIEDAIQARLKSLPLGELADLGLTLGEPRINQPITNPAGAWSMMAMAGIPTEKLWKAVDIKKGVLNELIQESLNLTKKAASEWIKDKLTPFITPQPCEKPLEKI